MIRVLIVEDSATSRLLLRHILESDPEIQVVGMAANGLDGVRLALALKPDLITMDIRMPVMDGFEATRRIMEEQATPIVVISSSVEDSELMITFNAIRAGALEVIEKPRGGDHGDFQLIREQLITTVKLMSAVKVIHRYRPSSTAPQPTSSRRPEVWRLPSVARARLRALSAPRRRLSLLAVGASTGVPAALNILLKALPADFPLPIVAVQHMAIGFTAGLVSWLQLECPLPIKQADDGERIRGRCVYFAPDDTHLEVSSRGVLGLSKAPPVSHVRPSATVLFESVARVYGPEAIGVLLTGMGEDGAKGLKEMHDRGSPTLAQDEATSAVYGMPKVAAELGAVDRVLPIGQIGPAIAALVGGGRE